MASKSRQQQHIEELLAKYDDAIRDAFLASIRDIVDRAQLGRIIERLERGDIDGAVRALNIEPAAFQPLDTAIRQAFVEGGTATAATIPPTKDPFGATIIIRFDVRMPSAERWIANHSSNAITEIVEDQRIAVRAALTEGLAAGINPRATALNVVGRISPATGRREGGIVGLSSVQERYAANARAELLSGDAGRMKRYLGRQRRDRRFDNQVMRAIKEGRAVDAETVNRIIGRYGDRLLALRGEVIGRTETMASINAARHEAWEQAAAKGGFLASSVRKVWVATRDLRTRDSHRNLNGDSVGLNERFKNGLLYPGDAAGPISELANCRCRLIYRRDFFSNLR